MIDYATLTLSAPAVNLNKKGINLSDIDMVKIDKSKNINSVPAQ